MPYCPGHHPHSSSSSGAFSARYGRHQSAPLANTHMHQLQAFSPLLFRGQASKPGQLPTMGTTWKDWHHPNGSSTGRSCPGFIPLGQPPSEVGRRLARHGLHMGHGKELGRVLARDEVRSLCLSILNLVHPQGCYELDRVQLLNSKNVSCY